jgi:AcrR family transcriptional regulator
MGAQPDGAAASGSSYHPGTSMTSAPAADTARQNEGLEAGEAPLDKRAQRRVARHAQSRSEILDAAEQVFGEDGPRAGSLRRIAELSGFSPAGIYLFFENKQDLLVETLRRRGDEWTAAVRDVAQSELVPMEMLHRIVDLAVDFFATYPYFRLLLRHIDRGTTMSSEPTNGIEGHYLDVVTQIGNIMRQGQASGQIREGGGRSLAHLYSVLIGEFVLLDAVGSPMAAGTLSLEQFHQMIDGAFRATPRR